MSALGSSNVLTESIATIRAKNPKLIGEVFNEVVQMSAANANVLSRWEGAEGSGKPFTVRNELKKGRGDRVNFSTIAPMNMSPRRGSDELEGYEENPDEGSYFTVIDRIRGAIGFDQLRQYLTVTGSSIEEAYAMMTGDWGGRVQQDDMFMTLLKSSSAAAGNIIRPGRRSSLAGLTASDYINTTTITEAVSLLKNRGGKPITVGKAPSGEDWKKYLIFGTDCLLNPLNAYSTYYQAQSYYAQERGMQNTNIAGGYMDFQGHALHHFDPVDVTTPGAISAPILPKARLGDAFSSTSGSQTFTSTLATDSTIDLSSTGANSTTIVLRGNGRLNSAMGDKGTYYEPFRFFKGYAFKTYSEESISADATVYYAMIYDPADGKYNIISYTGSTNTGHSITILSKLAATATTRTGTATNDVVTLAGHTYFTINAAGRWKNTFGVGSWIIPIGPGTGATPAGAGAAGSPYGYGFVLGRDACVKAYGRAMVERIRNMRDYDSKRGVGVQYLYGQSAALETDNYAHNFVTIEATVEHQGIYPVQTAMTIS